MLSEFSGDNSEDKNGFKKQKGKRGRKKKIQDPNA
jgi:hypothetical protein